MSMANVDCGCRCASTSGATPAPSSLAAPGCGEGCSNGGTAAGLALWGLDAESALQAAVKARTVARATTTMPLMTDGRPSVCRMWTIETPQCGWALIVIETHD